MDIEKLKMDIEKLKKEFSTQVPCTEEEAEKRIKRAKLMSEITMYSFNMYLKTEKDMCMKGIMFSGISSTNFNDELFKAYFLSSMR